MKCIVMSKAIYTLFSALIIFTVLFSCQDKRKASSGDIDVQFKMCTVNADSDSIVNMLCRPGYWIIYTADGFLSNGKIVYHPIANAMRFLKNGKLCCDLYDSTKKNYGGKVKRVKEDISALYSWKWQYEDSTKTVCAMRPSRLVGMVKDTLYVDACPFRDIWVYIGTDFNKVRNELDVEYNDQILFLQSDSGGDGFFADDGSCQNSAIQTKYRRDSNGKVHIVTYYEKEAKIVQ